MDVKPISAEEFERRFDDGEDISEYIDWSKARVINPDAKHVGLLIPTLLMSRLEGEAERRGETPQALILDWLRERLDALS